MVERKELDVCLVVEFDECPQRHPASQTGDDRGSQTGSPGWQCEPRGVALDA